MMMLMPEELWVRFVRGGDGERLVRAPTKTQCNDISLSLYIYIYTL